MAIAHDVFSNIPTFTSTVTKSHTPVGTPRAVLVVVCQNNGTASEMTGVTYGGVSMTLVRSDPGTTETPNGRIYWYFLGSSVPSGTQNVVCTATGGTLSKFGGIYTMTAGGDCSVVTSGAAAGAAAATRTLTLSIGSVSSYVASAWHTTDDAVAGLTAGGSHTLGVRNDFGTEVWMAEYMTAIQTGATAVTTAGGTAEAWLGSGVAVREGSATTAIGDEMSLLWDARQAVGQADQLLWNVRQAVGDPLSLQWNVTTSVGDTLQTIWNVRTSLGDSLSLVWDARAAVGDPLQLVWNIRQAVGDPLQLIWHVTTAVGDTVQLIWHARTAVGDQVQLLWDVLALTVTAIGNEVALGWDARAAVGDTTQLVWNIRTSLGDQLQVVWNARAAVGDTTSLVWDVRALVAELLDIQWHVRTTLGDSLVLRWDARAGIGRPLVVLWDTQSSVVIVTRAPDLVYSDGKLHLLIDDFLGIPLG